MNPLFNDLDTAIDFDQENDNEDDMLESLSRKLSVGGGFHYDRTIQKVVF